MENKKEFALCEWRT